MVPSSSQIRSIQTSFPVSSVPVQNFNDVGSFLTPVEKFVPSIRYRIQRPEPVLGKSFVQRSHLPGVI